MVKNKPSICFVAPNAFPLLAGRNEIETLGGAEVQQVIVARALAMRGYSVSMVCLDFGQEDETVFDGIRVLRAFRKDEGIPGLRFVWPRLWKIWNCLSRADADIYYQRAAGMLTGVTVAYCRRHARKSVFAASGNPNMERNTDRIRFRRDRWIYEYGVKNVDRILVQNQEQARLCKQNFGREPLLVPNCYLLPRVSATAGKRKVLWVGMIRSIKRPQAFVDLASALPECEFIMVGGAAPGEEWLYEKIRLHASRLDNLQFTGFVPYSEVDSYFDQAAILVNTSQSEGFPNTFLQAWSRGVPTISFVDSGARYSGNPVGLQVVNRDEMIVAVSKLMHDERSRIELGEIGKAYAEAEHSLEKTLDLYERVFCDLVNG